MHLHEGTWTRSKHNIPFTSQALNAKEGASPLINSSYALFFAFISVYPPSSSLHQGCPISLITAHVQEDHKKDRTRFCHSDERRRAAEFDSLDKYRRMDG